MKYIHSNLIGTFVLNKDFNILDEHLFKNIKDYDGKDKIEKKLMKKHKAKELDKKDVKNLQEQLKDKKYFRQFYQNNFEQTVQDIKKSISKDDLINQTIANINDIDKTTNILVKRLRDWFKLSLPELDKMISDHETFTDLVINKSKKELLKELGITSENSMGTELKEEDLEEITELAKSVDLLYKLRKKHEIYLKNLMEEFCPNLLELCGITIGAKLFGHAKSLKRLALLPASTVQLLGAEKALFRHIKTGAPSPKYGIIFTHQLVQKARRKEQGIVARTLANKISLAVRVDFFKGEPIGKKLRKELEDKFKRK
ncbi:NOP58 family protein [archaeon]|nr:NOP58 family protein [archaeon]MBT3450731.1 NOP58 family protein [archaeon]MBT6869223.1 NOP58 family protein [archaeon]MBT7193759.1 NOP58 family protein [archaeon]MBT7381406.1 NOP58 family protein [archaeon]